MGDLTLHFSRDEFRCPCGCGRDDISLDLVRALERLREKVGFPLFITSGVRCEKYNKQIGGAVNSAHIRGLAADIWVCNSGMRYDLVKSALECGFRRIGIGMNFVHLDIDGNDSGLRS